MAIQASHETTLRVLQTVGNKLQRAQLANSPGKASITIFPEPLGWLLLCRKVRASRRAVSGLWTTARSRRLKDQGNTLRHASTSGRGGREVAECANERDSGRLRRRVGENIAFDQQDSRTRDLPPHKVASEHLILFKTLVSDKIRLALTSATRLRAVIRVNSDCLLFSATCPNPAGRLRLRLHVVLQGVSLAMCQT